MHLIWYYWKKKMIVGDEVTNPILVTSPRDHRNQLLIERPGRPLLVSPFAIQWMLLRISLVLLEVAGESFGYQLESNSSFCCWGRQISQTRCDEYQLYSSAIDKGSASLRSMGSQCKIRLFRTRYIVFVAVVLLIMHSLHSGLKERPTEAYSDWP